jgi:prolyl 4-hydroxylase
MISQTITPELRQWIVDQVKDGKRDTLLGGIMASGWTEEVALLAIEEALSGQIHQNAAAPVPVRPMPEPVISSTNTVHAGDREVQIVTLMNHPRLIVFSGVLSDSECDGLIELAQARLQRSYTVNRDTGENEPHATRTSDGMFFTRGENALCQTLEARMALLMQWPLEKGEGLQILRYGVGAEYKPHFDYFPLTDPGTPKVVERTGQRLASLICYLNTPTGGGTTVFPDLNLEISPIKGNAVFFSYDRPDPSTRTLHGGSPVLEGEKWVATKWVREREYL